MLGFHSDHAFGMREMRPLRVHTSADALRNCFLWLTESFFAILFDSAAKRAGAVFALDLHAVNLSLLACLAFDLLAWRR